MKVEKNIQGEVELPNYGVKLELTAQEAANLTDILGCNRCVPESLVISNEYRKDVKLFMSELFDKLNDLGFRRSHAAWKQ